MTDVRCPHCGQLNATTHLVFNRDKMVFEGDCWKCNSTISVEDRGSTLYIWVDGLYDYKSRASFQPEDWSGCRSVEVSCPIGWSLRSHRYEGVVLSDLLHAVLTASDVYAMAVKGEGFRVRSIR